MLHGPIAPCGCVDLMIETTGATGARAGSDHYMDDTPSCGPQALVSLMMRKFGPNGDPSGTGALNLLAQQGQVTSVDPTYRRCHRWHESFSNS